MEQLKFTISYVIGLAISTFLMFIFLFFTNTVLNLTFLVFFWAIKFLAGFGIILSIANGFLLLMDKLSNKLGERGTRVFVITQMIVPAIFIGYAIYLIVSGSISQTMFSTGTIRFWIDVLVFWYGIGSLLANLYIIPLASEQFYKAVELSKFSWWKKKAKKAARKVKKKFFTLKKDYAKAQVQDQMTVKEILDLWRNKFAVNLLLIFAIGTIVFTPIAFVCVLFWLRLYVFFRRRTMLYEKIALLLAMCAIGFIVAIFPFLDPNFPLLGSVYSSLRGYYWTVNISYLFGIIVATLVFIKKTLNLQGVTFQKLRMDLKEKKIETLEKEKEELKKKLEDQDKTIDEN